MIAFTKLGSLGRFGNQMFQYAFLRSAAKRLGTKFYCPEWIGDRIFILRDRSERTSKPEGVVKMYKQPENGPGFNEEDMFVADNTDVEGYFQSYRSFDNEAARVWYTFDEEKFAPIKKKYGHIDFSKSVGMHLRFGDMTNSPHYVIAGLPYYRRGLALAKRKENVLVFSDEINTAKDYMKKMDRGFIYVDESDYDSFYLMTLCHDFICSVSTFSWWAAWLNRYGDKIIVCPVEWVRPGYIWRNPDLKCEDWISIKLCRPLIDSYPIVNLRRRLSNSNVYGRIRRVLGMAHES